MQSTPSTHILELRHISILGVELVCACIGSKTVASCGAVGVRLSSFCTLCYSIGLKLHTKSCDVQAGCVQRCTVRNTAARNIALCHKQKRDCMTPTLIILVHLKFRSSLHEVEAEQKNLATHREWAQLSPCRSNTGSTTGPIALDCRKSTQHCHTFCSARCGGRSGKSKAYRVCGFF